MDDVLNKLIGLKVVRGPDWKWRNQDGGEGHVGTVVEVGRSGRAFDKHVFVVWNNGIHGYYRVGQDGAYDLRILDNGYTGIIHSGISCDSCRHKDLIGMRWKCLVCHDYDLCTQCYMSDKHDITHPFIRFLAHRRNMIEMPIRKGAVKIQWKDISSSGKVVGGQVWNWQRNNGYKNNIDLENVEDTTINYYYRDHLAILGNEARAVKEETSGKTPATGSYQKSNIVARKTESIPIAIKEFGKSKGFTDLRRNLEYLYTSGQFFDFTIKVKDREFRIHKVILSAYSPVFAYMFQHDMIASASYIPDCDPKVFEDFLLYLYSGNAERITPSNITGLYEVAEKYDVHCLKQDCLAFMVQNLTPESICDVITFAAKYSKKELLEHLTDFFALHAKTILLSTKWQNFVIENPIIANEFYIKAFIKNEE